MQIIFLVLIAYKNTAEYCASDTSSKIEEKASHSFARE